MQKWKQLNTTLSHLHLYPQPGYWLILGAKLCKIYAILKEVTSTEIWTLKRGLQRFGNLKINCLKDNVMKIYRGLTEKELRNFFVQNISKYNCIEQMLTDTYGKKGFCVAFGVEWKSYDEAIEVLTKYTSERPERANEQ